MIGVHKECNRTANVIIDNKLAACGHVQLVRAQAGVRHPRRATPYTAHLRGQVIRAVRVTDRSRARLEETLIDDLRAGERVPAEGAKVTIAATGQDLDARFLPNPLPQPDGSVEVFDTGRPDDEPSADDHAELFESYHLLAVVEAPVVCRHPPDTWQRFAAKVGLGLVPVLMASDEVLEDGTGVSEALSQEECAALVRDLRAIAFGSSSAYAGPSHPGRDSSKEAPARRHTVSLQATLDGMLLRLTMFDYLVYDLPIPERRLHHPIHVTLDWARPPR